MKIADLGSRKVKVTPAAGDTSTTIAELAQFVEFDPVDASRYDTSVPVIAYDALEDEYGAFGKVAGEADYYDGAWMEFSDGSVIRIT